MSGAADPNGSAVASTGKVRVFGSDRAFMRSIKRSEAVALIAHGLAQWSNGDLQLTGIAGAPMERQLDGYKPAYYASEENIGGTYNFRRRVLPA